MIDINVDELLLIDTTLKPYRCHRCRSRYHLQDLVERASCGAALSPGATWLLCRRCVVFHDAWYGRLEKEGALKPPATPPEWY